MYPASTSRSFVVVSLSLDGGFLCCYTMDYIVNGSRETPANSHFPNASQQCTLNESPPSPYLILLLFYQLLLLLNPNTSRECISNCTEKCIRTITGSLSTQLTDPTSADCDALKLVTFLRYHGTTQFELHLILSCSKAIEPPPLYVHTILALWVVIH